MPYYRFLIALIALTLQTVADVEQRDLQAFSRSPSNSDLQIDIDAANADEPQQVIPVEPGASPNLRRLPSARLSLLAMSTLSGLAATVALVCSATWLALGLAFSSAALAIGSVCAHYIESQHSITTEVSNPLEAL